MYCCLQGDDAEGLGVELAPEVRKEEVAFASCEGLALPRVSAHMGGVWRGAKLTALSSGGGAA